MNSHMALVPKWGRHTIGLVIILAAMLSGCGTINAYTGAALTDAAANYQGAKTNAQTSNDMKLTAWADAACAIPLGALSRAGSPVIIRAALTACPVPGVAVLP